MFSSLRNYAKQAKSLRGMGAHSLACYNYSAAASANFSRTRDIKVAFHEDHYTFQMVMPSDETKLFFLNENFTFKSLREMFLLENQKCKIDFNFPKGTSQQLIEEDTPIIKYLRMRAPSESMVTIDFDDFSYRLGNAGANEVNNLVEKFLGEKVEDPSSVLSWYQLAARERIVPSQRNVISYLATSINSNLSKLPKASNITERELDKVIADAIVNFSNPVNKSIEELLQKQNELNSKIAYLKRKIEGIESKAEKRILLYKRLIVLVSAVQAVAFYYMIFHVDWLGWDIIEPITYTCSQLTVLLSIRFFLKYGKTRSWDTIRRNFQQKIINKSKGTRDEYSFLNRKLADRIEQLERVENQITVLKNKRSQASFL